MRPFNKERHSGGQRRGQFSDRESRPLKLYDVVCDECGKETQVPFEPRNGRPVLCRECFSGNSDRPEPRREFRENEAPRERPQMGDLAVIHMKLDKIMRALKIE